MRAHIPPKKQEHTSAIANPFNPNHNPPVASNFMSPIPIGVSASGVRRRRITSNTKPVIAPSAYPVNAPIAATRGLQIQFGTKFTTTKPIKKSGHKYASGMMRRRKSATEIATAHPAAAVNKIAKNK